MLLKRLFYASASILMLAAAYHLGARNASAQASSVAAADCDVFSNSLSAVVGRTLYVLSSGQFLGPTAAIPGTSPVIACSYEGGGVLALLENGDCYAGALAGPPRPWTLQGNLFGGATPAHARSWGSLKAKYR